MGRFTCAKCGNPLEFVDALDIEREALRAELRKVRAQLAAKDAEVAWRAGGAGDGAEADVTALQWKLKQAQAALKTARLALEKSRSWEWTPDEADEAIAEIEAARGE
jgi:hypothetical protein